MTPDKQDIETLFELLKDRFGQPAARLFWRDGEQQSFAKIESREIHLATLGWSDKVPSLCHEFAHLLAGNCRTASGARRPHGHKFIAALKTVCEVVYTRGVYEYPWGNEYRSIVKIAKQLGWLNETTPAATYSRKPDRRGPRTYCQRCGRIGSRLDGLCRRCRDPWLWR